MNLNHVIFMLCCSWLSVAFESSNRCSTDDGSPCAADEYFDIIVCLCASCADICRLRPDRTTDSSCQQYCPDYYKQTTLPRHGLIVKDLVSSSTSVSLLLPVHEDNALVKKPLFWTSVVSVFISVVATIVLIVLCTCKKSRSVLALRRPRRMQPPYQTRMPANGASEKGESSTGMLRAAEEGTDPLLSSVKHISKDKCSETFAPLVCSHPMSMNSCDALCETDISHCESSFCLHKPCVSPFRDSGFLADHEKLCMYSVDDRSRTSTNASTSASTSASTNASAGLILTAANNTVTCKDTSARTTNSGRSESLDSSLNVQGSEKPSEAMEICAMESGYFNSSSCVGATTGCELGCTLYTIPVASGVVTEKEIDLPSMYPVQETRNYTEEGNNSADGKIYKEIFQSSLYGFESKPSNNRQSLGFNVKPNYLMLLHRLFNSTCDESALQESSEETGLKKTQSDAYCSLNCMPSASHNKRSCEIYVHAKDGSIQALERLIDGKQLAELNLKIRSNADAPQAKSEPCFFNLELRESTRHEEVNNDEDTAVKNWKRNTYS